MDYDDLLKDKPQKLYCYVDETGQDTKGKFFLVAIVVTGQEREMLNSFLELIETVTFKGKNKWKKTALVTRVAYIREIMHSKMFSHKIKYSVFSGNRDYKEMTIIATAKAIESVAPIDYSASVFIDGLGKTERFRISAGLRQRHIVVKKVRGVKDESNALIRLADAIAGFVRDYTEGDEEMELLYAFATATGLIEKL